MTVLNIKQKLTNVILSAGTFRYDFCVSWNRYQSNFINLKIVGYDTDEKKCRRCSAID